MVKKSAIRKVLSGHFDPTNECLRKTKRIFVGQIDELLTRADRPKDKVAARRLCRTVYNLLQTKEFKTSKACGKIYSWLWRKFQKTCKQFIGPI